MHVFGLWGEAGVPRESPHRHRENTQTPGLESNPRPSGFKVTGITTPLALSRLHDKDKIILSQSFSHSPFVGFFVSMFLEKFFFSFFFLVSTSTPKGKKQTNKCFMHTEALPHHTSSGRVLYLKSRKERRYSDERPPKRLF